ncbi:TetR family transcriptional regulator [Leucobacter sp. NPDC077196]|uniref:TetR family transcriptional regulator n=1 Tax=Leucobacter sp. NPDC077196 TaxID=3154959 RepID=UPI00341DDEB8
MTTPQADAAADAAAPGAPLTREQRKAQTSAAIRTAALDLIEELDFERASIDGIAARAGVARRTFFRYFPCKEAVLFGGSFFPGVAAELHARLGRGESPMHAAFSALRDNIDYPATPSDEDVRRRRLRQALLAVPSVNAYYRTSIASFASEISETVRRHPQHAAVPMLPELVGGLMQIVLLEHVRSGGTAHLRVDEKTWRAALVAALG